MPHVGGLSSPARAGARAAALPSRWSRPSRRACTCGATSATTASCSRATGPRPRGAGIDHISPGVLRILDRLADTPAEVVGELGESLRQTPLAAPRSPVTRPPLAPAPRAAWVTAAPSPTRRPGRCTRPRTTRSSPGCSPPGCAWLVTLRGPGVAGRPPGRPAPRRRARSSATLWDDPRGRRPAARRQALRPPRGRRARAELPVAARPGPVPPPARLHRRPGQREPREAAAALRHREPVPGASLTGSLRGRTSAVTVRRQVGCRGQDAPVDAGTYLWRRRVPAWRGSGNSRPPRPSRMLS